MSGQEEIAKILTESLPRELLLSYERLYPSALERAITIGNTAERGHRASVIGHNRHFFLNEALMLAFEECGISHPPLRGNRILVGKVRLASLARVHMNAGKWDNSRRSKAKVKLCAPNRIVASMVQLDWLQEQYPEPVETFTAFLVTQGDSTDSSPCQCYLVIPDETMDFRNPIFAEELTMFIRRYQQAQDVLDIAQPKLKASAKRQPRQDES